MVQERHNKEKSNHHFYPELLDTQLVLSLTNIVLRVIFKTNVQKERKE